MESSEGRYFYRIDHIRALAAFIVFVWHFIHSSNGFPVQFNYMPAIFPLAIFDEGHTGVALFMTLSGYLFAKLIGDKQINYWYFIFNRAIRLLPLLVIVVLIVGVYNCFFENNSILDYGSSILKGFIFPVLPNGGWSVTVEFHFYIILPILLFMLRTNIKYLAALIIIFILFRLSIWSKYGEVQTLAYWTIIGRIDQFVFGILAFNFRNYLKNRHLLFSLVFISFCLFYYYFDVSGGFYNNPSYPSPSTLWIIIPSIEGVAYGMGIAWYAESFGNSGKGIFFRFFADLGKYSYSIYLFHFFFVFKIAKFVNNSIMPISNFYIGFLWAAFFYMLMWPIGYLSFRYIEKPLLKYRKKYIIY